MFTLAICSSTMQCLMDSTMLWKETAGGFSHKQETRQENYCEDDVLAFHLHTWFLLNFQFSVKKKKTGENRL